MENKNAPQWKVILAFIAIYFVWGTTYLANLFALESFTPFILSCFRYLLAGSLLSAWLLIKKMRWPGKEMMKILSISGVLMLVGGSGLVVYAEQYINSGFAAVLIATEPLWFVLLDRKRWRWYFSDKKIIAGLLTGFAGIIFFAHFSPGTGSNAGIDNKVLGCIIILLSAIIWVCGTLYANNRIATGSSNITNSAVQLIAAAVFAGMIAVADGEWADFKPSAVTAHALGGLVFLVVMGSLIAYIAFTWLITVRPPAVVSTHTFVNPVVAILIGWAMADEPLNFKQIIALAIVLTGVFLTQTGKRPVPG